VDRVGGRDGGPRRGRHELRVPALGDGTRGEWVITGGTGAYADATGHGTFAGRNLVFFPRTREGCGPEPDRLVSSLRLVGA
jgi:hypothetical protein